MLALPRMANVRAFFKKMINRLSVKSIVVNSFLAFSIVLLTYEIGVIKLNAEWEWTLNPKLSSNPGITGKATIEKLGVPDRMDTVATGREFKHLDFDNGDSAVIVYLYRGFFWAREYLFKIDDSLADGASTYRLGFWENDLRVYPCHTSPSLQTIPKHYEKLASLWSSYIRDPELYVVSVLARKDSSVITNVIHSMDFSNFEMVIGDVRRGDCSRYSYPRFQFHFDVEGSLLSCYSDGRPCVRIN